MFRPHGGASRFTLRRLFVLVTHLPPESAFQSAISGRVPISEIGSLLLDLWELSAQRSHPRWTELERRRDAIERQKIMEIARAKARRFNAIGR